MKLETTFVFNTYIHLAFKNMLCNNNNLEDNILERTQKNKSFAHYGIYTISLWQNKDGLPNLQDHGNLSINSHHF